MKGKKTGGIEFLGRVIGTRVLGMKDIAWTIKQDYKKHLLQTEYY